MLIHVRIHGSNYFEMAWNSQCFRVKYSQVSWIKNMESIFNGIHNIVWFIQNWLQGVSKFRSPFLPIASCLPTGPLILKCLTLIPAWISHPIHNKMWDGIDYFPFPNFNGATIEILEQIPNSTQQFTENVYTLWLKIIDVCKGSPHELL